MATVAPSGGGIHAAVENRNAGTVIHAGTPAADSPIQNVLSIATLADDFGASFGSRVIAKDGNLGSTTDSVGISGARAGAIVDGTTVLGYNANATEWVVRGGNVTSTLGGSANTVLVSAGRDWSGDLNDDLTKVNRMQTSGVRLGSYSSTSFDVLAAPSTQLVPGRTKGTGAGSWQSWVNPADGTVAVASEIAPSRSVPGELTYHFGSGALPTNDNYKASNIAE